MIAIVLINYNSKRDTINCVRSVMNSERIELPFIIIVDNNSKEKIHDSDFVFYPNIKLIQNNENLGFGKANNIGIKWAIDNLNSAFIFILNNDTVVVEESIINLVENFPNEKEVVMISPKILTYEQNPKIWYGGGTFNYRRISININGINLKNKELSDKYVDFASGCAMFFRTNFLKENLAFDDHFFMYDEDVELSIRIRKNGQKIYFTNKSVIYHKCQGSQEKPKHINQLHPLNPNIKFYLSNTIPNRYYIVKKHFHKSNRIIMTLNLTLYWLAKSFQFFIYGRVNTSITTLKLILKSL